MLALHAVAGCAPALTDSLQRLLRMRRGGAESRSSQPRETARFAPVQRVWGNRHAAELVNAHLQRLWSVGTAPFAAIPHAVVIEPALHG